jgi:tetratricopeptide (TPR) repeat protein
MKPFLEYGWQPQVMSVAGHHKVILAGRAEAYDLAADAAETHDIAAGPDVPTAVRNAAYDYPVPTPTAARAPDTLNKDERQKLASLGYVSAGSTPDVRKDAPRPADMVKLFGVIEQASTLFVNERYAQVIPLLEQILTVDSHNLDATLRLATAHSALGHDAKAVELFEKAAALAPKSADVRLYLALHYARGKEWPRAVPELERIVSESPERVPAIEALAAIRERQDRVGDAVALRQQLYRLRPATTAESLQLGELAMRVEQTNVAITAFEAARAAQGRAFAHDLELGVLYLAARQFTDARDALDRVPASHPQYPMALFKRAQVSVLLHEPDAAARIDLARRKADATTRSLIATEKLFQRK